ncbi:MAG TPA: ABC transporter permease subunit, partial [Syntrophomonas sp.]|nr:ABC transporter permease subunit [Syntrophomonas sp.]
MNRWRGQRALLQKELRHHRGYFLVALLLLIYVPVLKSLYYLGQGGGVTQQWGQCLTYMLNFYQLPMGPPPLLQGSLHVFWLAAPILLGALLLGEERKGSLAFLVTTPVSRGDIILSKFLAGSASLLLAMAVNGAFLLAMSETLGVGVGAAGILRWELIMSLGLIALFTLALFTSTFTASALPAAGISFVLIYVPGALIAMAENMAARYFNASQSFSIKAHYLANYLTITDYLTGEHWNVIQSVDHFSDWMMYGISGMIGPAPRLELETIPLALAIIGLLGLAVLIFNRISLEEQGVLFAGRRTRLVFIVLGGLLISYVLVFPICRTLP